MGEDVTTKKHKEENKKALVAIITLSDTRALSEDESGHFIKTFLENDGHKVVSHVIIRDENEVLKSEILRTLNNVNVIITNGGTGLSKRDITPETVEPLFEKKLSSFSTLFSLLSYQDIGSAALVSRATAGVIGKTAVFCMPGSPKAVKLGMEKIILPEIGHIIKHLGD